MQILSSCPCTSHIYIYIYKAYKRQGAQLPNSGAANTFKNKKGAKKKKKTGHLADSTARSPGPPILNLRTKKGDRAPILNSAQVRKPCFAPGGSSAQPPWWQGVMQFFWWGELSSTAHFAFKLFLWGELSSTAHFAFKIFLVGGDSARPPLPFKLFLWGETKLDHPWRIFVIFLWFFCSDKTLSVCYSTGVTLGFS